MKNEEIIRKLIEEPLLAINIKVDNVFYHKEGAMNVLKITIDKDPYIDVDDCVEATKIINPILDNKDLIKASYVLDVCSKEKGGSK